MLTTNLKRARNYRFLEGGVIYITPKGYLVSTDMPYLIHAFKSQAEMVRWCCAFGEADFDESQMPEHLRHPILFPRAKKEKKRKARGSKIVECHCQYDPNLEFWTCWVKSVNGTCRVVLMPKTTIDMEEADLRLAFVDIMKRVFNVNVKAVLRVGDRLLGDF